MNVGENTYSASPYKQTPYTASRPSSLKKAQMASVTHLCNLQKPNNKEPGMEQANSSMGLKGPGHKGILCPHQNRTA